MTTPTDLGAPSDVANATVPVFHDAAWFAARTGLKESWVRRHAATLPHHRIGRFLRFSEDSVTEFLESTRQSAAAEFQVSARSTRRAK